MNGLRAVLLAALLAGSSMGLVAQECHDWDGDQSSAGWECAAADDCSDRWWGRRPGAQERCNGIDENCDGTLDEGCDLSCDELFHVLLPRELPLEAYSHFRTADAVRTDRGLLVGAGMHEQFDNYLSRLFMRAYDDFGVPWDSAHEMDEDPSVRHFDDYDRIVSAGDRALVVWIDSEPALIYEPLWARVVDELGRPVGPAWDLSTGVDEVPTIAGASPVWDGDRFVVFWTAEGSVGSLYMSVLSVDGEVWEPRSRLVAKRAGGDSSEIDNPVAFWTGDHYLVFFSAEGSIRVMRVSRHGQPLEPAKPIPGTERFLNGVQGDGRIGLVWSEQLGSAPEFAYLAIVDEDGRVQDPPGVIPLRTQPLPDDRKSRIYVTWTGDMYLVASEVLRWQGGEYHYRWVMWRVLPDGTVLDPDGFLISDTDTTRRLHAIVWSGKELWVFGARYKPALNEWGLFWERVVCSCADQDGDTYDACTMMDCDDTNPNVSPGAPEICRGLLDDDCDGSVDCADTADCPGSPGPPAITNMVWDSAGLAWSAVADAEAYDLARGLISDRLRRGDFLQAECAGPELSEPRWTDDGRRPPAGDALWYLTRPEGAPCALGPWGVDTVREVNACR